MVQVSGSVALTFNTFLDRPSPRGVEWLGLGNWNSAFVLLY